MPAPGPEVVETACGRSVRVGLRALMRQTVLWEVVVSVTADKYEVSDMGWSGVADVEAFIEGRAAVEGGAFCYDEVFGLVTITRAEVPSRLPGALIGCSHNRLFFRGRWQQFSEAARVREQNKRDW